MSQPDVTEADVQAVVDVLRTPWLSLGPKLPEFEEKLADYVGCRYAVAVNSGTSALHLIVRSLGIGEGDEVITSPFSFVASTNCLLYERARPVFVDIDRRSLNLDVGRIEAALTPRTRAILAVDVFGRPADWNALRQLAARHDLLLIEDSCEALGARYRLAGGDWARCGSLGEAGCFAFYPNKQMTTGEGGMIVTDREDLAALCRSLRNQGRDEGAGWLQHARLGFNYRLSDINCALGLAQLERLEEILAARRQVAAWYAEALAELPDFEVPPPEPGAEISWFVYVVRLAAEYTRADRDALLTGLRERGVGCNNYFSPIHLQPYIRDAFGYREGDFPVTEAVSAQTIALPFHTRLTEREVREVARLLGEVRSRLRGVSR
ncbi:MAG TPA: DegT/DnrJ/EryC1/StrS family aminotransferase [Armatimonadota bacterium]